MEAATRTGIHLFHQPVLDFVFILCAFQQRPRCNIAMREVLRNVGEHAHNDTEQVCTRFCRSGKLTLKRE